MKTVGQPSIISASADTKQMSVSRRGIAHIELGIMDENGNPVFLSQPEITCTVVGSAKLLGLENSNPRDTTRYKINHRTAYKGKLVAYVQASNNVGPVTLTFTSPGLKPAHVVLQSTR